ncbi:Meiotic coiled-coil protein [Lachnellula suecica]|uniref:Meiotic coiled-coil protein n=1 Tax=Lachnellula suecica TaxID=602035 RepID=A0A8T9CK41_9HELO|nr:Meiotic coiled-coil protein [Lachnellula suecica]
MSAAASTGSPTPRRSAGRSSSQENPLPMEDKMLARNDGATSLKKSAAPLTSSLLGNQAAPKKAKTSHDSGSSSEPNPMDKLLAKLSEQSAAINKQQQALKNSDDNIAFSRTADFVSNNSSITVTPATETAPSTSPASVVGDVTPKVEDDEVFRLKQELEAAKGKIARMDQELAQSRITKHTIDQAMGSASEADYPINAEAGGLHINMPQPINNAIRPQIQRDTSWAAQDDNRSDTSDALSANDFNRARSIWNNNGRPMFNAQGPVPPPNFQPPEALAPNQWMNRGFGQPFVEAPMPFSGPPMNSFRDDRMAMTPEPDLLMAPPGGRRNQVGGRYARGSFPYASSSSSYDGYTPNSMPFGSVGGMGGGVNPQMPMNNNMGGGGSMYGGYQPQPIGTPLSPHAPEFNASASGYGTATEGQTYLPTTEPLNYRRLLDRTVNCNWKYIVDKIVCNNDQQASIFLQQKLKVGTPDQKYDIVEAIVAQAYPLMVNRFGNFLVQRCFEHGTGEQVIKIAEAIRGNTLNLSMDAFGCHVVQKAFDSVPEDYKAIMVHELLRRIPETVVHRYACHVWQKLFELRWTESPPQIMKYVNEALHGMWHEVALGETGSLVVQNIFENCLEEDKRPCIEEVLASIDIVAHGQFGNWCIQHICEHGAPADRSRAIDHVIRYASEYSMDQFASKVVEKCLKIGGVDFLGRYLDRVCEGRHDRPRIPLIDIASDQYGNYLIQYILTHSNPQHREIVACHIRKHMVSLRGSKFGSRVGMLCTNPAIQTRPGPGVGPSIGAPAPRMPPQPPRYGGPYR